MDVPILMYSAEHDPHTPIWMAHRVRNGVAEASKVEHHLVPGAGHFVFLSPFPAPMVNPGFPPSQDPPGFDRAAFHVRLNDEVLAFLSRVL